MSSVEKVFQIDLLREIILEYACVIDHRNENLPVLHACRLVQKTWLESTSKILRESRLPLFRLELGERRGVTEDAEFLNKFVNEFTKESRKNEHIPTFSLKLSKNFFRMENYQSFANCLELCGQSLIDLEVTFPKDGGSMTFLFPDISLPLLRRLDFRFTNQPMNNFRKDSTFGSNNNSVYFLQSILSAGSNLHSFALYSTSESQYDSFNCERLVPFGIEFLKLPLKIMYLMISCNVKTKDLEVLTRNSLPKLKCLDLCIPCKQLKDDVIYRILENLSASLETLIFLDYCNHGCRKQTTFFRFPKMEKLKALESHNSPCELEENLTKLEEFLPFIKELHLYDFTVSNFHSWTQRSRFESVKELNINLKRETFNLERMQILDKAFPNLRMLEITVVGKDFSGIRYIFQEMKQLERLQLCQENAYELQHSNLWDAVLLGVSEELVGNLRNCPDLYNHLENKNELLSSIKNLTELQELKLTGSKCPVNVYSFISDVVYHLAFLKMPNLKKLSLNGPFYPLSESLIEEWKGHGRCFETDNRLNEDLF